MAWLRIVNGIFAMLFRFSLYGFLKNQQYFDPFLILAFREKGLSFLMIGLLIGFRELCINILEVPTGAIADVAGRRRSMVFSFLAYIVAFLIFGLLAHPGFLFAAMFFFAIGEAFRTGTHKAMIFDWLSREGRAGEKTKVYGFTRSWSKIGSALSVVIAAALVFTTGSYSQIFLWCLIPYVANIVNFMTYPKYLDGPMSKGTSVSRVFHTLIDTLKSSVRNRPLRRLFVESMGFEGGYKVCKDYLQPAIKLMVLSLPLLLFCQDHQRTAVLVGAVYFVLYLAGSYASRHAGSFAKWAGGEVRGARRLWWMYATAFGVLTVGVLMNWGRSVGHVNLSGQVGMGIAIFAFVVLSIIQNFWRPMLISRFADHADPKRTATVLSIESQGKSLFAAAIAPLLGLAVDLVARYQDGLKLLPVGILGVAIALVMILLARPCVAKNEPPSRTEEC